MGEEENILKMIIERESWEEVIYQIVSLENLNPWDVDLVKLTHSFLKYMNQLQLKEINFRMPAKIVFLVAVLLRLKADYLSIFEEEETIEDVAKQAGPLEQLGIDPSLIQLGVPMKRMPKRQITLDELMGALKKAMEVRVKREIRRQVWEERLRVQFTEEEDIAKRIDEMMKEIDEKITKTKADSVSFSDVVKEWNREEVVDKFVPMLHLEQNQKIKTEQEDFFKEIYISRRISPKEKESSE
jgi:chromatin segregation and condensation protein Rec8/ScpA/Scc1 (kleisin family)